MARGRTVDLSVIPIEADEVWQGGLSRFPSWIEPRDDGEPFRPWFAAWCNAGNGYAYPPQLGDRPARDPGLLIEALHETVRKAGMDAHLPGRLQLTDPRDAALVREGLAGTGIVVDVVERVPAFLHLRDALRERARTESNVPSLSEGEGVGVEQARAFADAAADFYHAEPWEHFDNEDLIEIECELADPRFRIAAIMGAGGDEFGLFFMDSREHHASIISGAESKRRVERSGGDWGLSFVMPYEIPLADHDFWLDNELPLADGFSYPFPVRIGPGDEVGRPNARQLAYFEGLMRAIVDSSEEEIDSGAWEKTVSTSLGTVTVRMRLPLLLEAEAAAQAAGDARTQAPRLSLDPRGLERGLAEIQRFISSQEFGSQEELEAALHEKFAGRTLDEIPSTASTPLEKAQEIASRAFEASGRARIKLARQALAVSPDCADAYGILAGRSNDPEKTHVLLEQGVEAGERAMQSIGITGDAVQWGDIRCRPYLRVRFALAMSLAGFDALPEAIEHFEELLRLDANDHQGVRYRMLPLLIEEGRDSEALALLERFPTDLMAMWPYARALLAFRAEGATPRADELADRAIKTNPFLWKFLAGTQELPDHVTDTYRPGSREEAIVVAEDLIPVWDETAGAGDWIRARGRNRSKGDGRSGGKPSGGRGKGKRR